MLHPSHAAVAPAAHRGGSGAAALGARICRPAPFGCRQRTASLRGVAAAAAAAGNPGYGQPATPAFPVTTGHSSSGQQQQQLPLALLDKPQQVARLLAAKEASGKTFTQIAAEARLTNIYAAQLFYRQQQLQPGSVAALQAAVPALTDDDVACMQRAPMRSFDPCVLQEPAVYRLYEAITHGGESLKAIINEEFGDGIMSAIDFYAELQQQEGEQGERRVVITLNGKFLPYVEQRAANNVAARCS